MTTTEVAHRLVALCREGQFEQAVAELYAPNVVSIEPEGAPNHRVQGLDQIRKKGAEFDASMEVLHEIRVSDPVISNDHFSIAMWLDATMKGVGRVPMDEICVYGVENGKITSEQFFYRMDESMMPG